MDEYKAILQNHEARIKKLEKTMGLPKKAIIKKGKKTLIQHIVELRENGFFSQTKTAVETHKELQNTYSCELNRVEVALIRLVGKKQLRKASKILNKKKYRAYVW